MIRIVAGEYGGRRIAAPPGRSTRPTSEKVRGAIFNVLAARGTIEDAVVWDLYAGSGAMGIEALSRGARHSIFVESSRRAAEGIRATLESLGIPRERWTVAAERVGGWLSHAPPPDGPLIVLADPPYAANEGELLLPRFAAMEGIPVGTLIVLESTLDAAPTAVAALELIQVKRYGGTNVHYYVKIDRDSRFNAELESSGTRGHVP